MNELQCCGWEEVKMQVSIIARQWVDFLYQAINDWRWLFADGSTARAIHKSCRYDPGRIAHWLKWEQSVMREIKSVTYFTNDPEILAAEGRTKSHQGQSEQIKCPLRKKERKKEYVHDAFFVILQISRLRQRSHSAQWQGQPWDDHLKNYFAITWFAARPLSPVPIPSVWVLFPLPWMFLMEVRKESQCSNQMHMAACVNFTFTLQKLRNFFRSQIPEG